MKNTLLLLFSGFLLLAFYSCGKKDMETLGLRPIFISYNDFSHIESQAPREFEDLGKIIALGDFLFINERRKGIHVIDNRNPSNPVKTHFWNIPGNRELIIIGDILYADNGKHLLLINVSDFDHITLVDYLSDIYEPERISDLFPDGYDGWFTCVNERNGIFNGWEEATLINPKCKTN